MNSCFRALLCSSCLAACSPSVASVDVRDPTYVEEPALAPAEPAATPASLDEQRAPSANQLSAEGALSAPHAALASTSGAAPDDTQVNEHDTAATALTPGDQKENPSNLTLTQKIRQAAVADSLLSFTAKNEKSITQDGQVSPHSPVNSVRERSAIDAAARKVAGDSRVDNSSK